LLFSFLCHHSVQTTNRKGSELAQLVSELVFPVPTWAHARQHKKIFADLFRFQNSKARCSVTIVKTVPWRLSPSQLAMVYAEQAINRKNGWRVRYSTSKLNAVLVRGITKTGNVLIVILALSWGISSAAIFESLSGQYKRKRISNS
jgi:hypothetical protein